MRESCRDVSGERVHGVKARDMRTSKEYRKDPAACRVAGLRLGGK